MKQEYKLLPPIESGRNSRSPRLLNTMEQSPRENSQGRRYVDVTLFGSAGRRHAQSPFGQSSGQIYSQEIRNLRIKVEKGQPSEACIISKNELDRIKSVLFKKNDAEKDNLKETLELTKTDAKSKVEKLKKLDQMRQESDAYKKNDLSLEQIQRAQGTLTKAQQQLDEELDDVKEMSKRVFFGKVQTIRDKQIQENKQLENEYIDHQKKLDLMMEIERLKLIKDDEQREIRRINARKVGAQVIINQIKDKCTQRMMDQENKQKELFLMQQAAKQQRDEEEKIRQEKQLQARKMLQELEQANKMESLRKEQKKLEEKELLQKLQRVNQEIQLKEFERQKNEQFIKSEKERQIQKLIEKQQLMNFKIEGVDAERAQRLFEKTEKEAFMRDQSLKDKRQQMLQELEASREKQFKDKETLLQEHAKSERDEYLKIIMSQKEDEEKEKRIEEQKKTAFKMNNNALIEQINQNNDKKKQEKLDYIEEGRMVRQKLADEILKLETIRSNKLKTMESIGIKEQYQLDLKIQKIKEW